MSFLDEPLFFLARPRPGVLDIALLHLGTGRAALLFTREDAANAHLATLPHGVGVARAEDLREKEELLQAALERGAARLWLDAVPDGEPALTYPTARALAYIRSFKRQSACL